MPRSVHDKFALRTSSRAFATFDGNSFLLEEYTLGSTADPTGMSMRPSNLTHASPLNKLSTAAAIKKDASARRCGSCEREPLSLSVVTVDRVTHTHTQTSRVRVSKSVCV